MSEPVANDPVTNDPDPQAASGGTDPDPPDGGSPARSGAEPRVAGSGETPEPGSVQSTVREVRDGGKVTAVENHYHQEQFLIDSFEKRVRGDAFLRPTRLTPDHFEPFSDDRLAQNSRRIIFRPEELEHLEFLCEQHRVLFLEGPPNVGKGSLVESLGARLCRGRGPRQLKVSRLAFTRHLKVNIRSLISDREGFGNCVVLIEDAFDHENEDMLQFARETNALRLGALEDDLFQAGSFLIFTYDTERRPATLHPVLQERVEEILGPSAEQLELYLGDAARQQLDDGEENVSGGRAILEEIVSQNGAALIERLRSLPRIEIFVRGPLAKLARHRKITLEEVLAEIERLDRGWFEEQAEDLGALSFLLALTICHASPEGLEVQWFHFERLRCRVEERLRQELHLEDEKRSARELCRESELMRRFGVEVVRGAEGDRLRFIDQERPARLWTDLLGAGRRLAAAVEPALEDLSNSEAYYLRWHAGWALGRLAQLDHHGLFGRLFHRWTRESATPQRRAEKVGSLVQGALLSGDQRLDAMARDRVRALCHDSAAKEAETGVLVLGEIALVDPAWALAEIRQVIRKHLLPCLESLQAWDTKRRRAESTTQRLTGSADWRRVVAGLHDEQLEKDLEEDLPRLFPAKEEYRVLMALQYALVGLCFELGAVSVLKELKHWIPAGEIKFSQLLALLFLRPRGLVEILERFPVRVNVEGRRESWSSILVSASSSKEGTRELADFLQDLHLGAWQLPGAMGRALEKRWYTLIVQWTRQASGSTKYRSVVIDLWWELRRTLYREIRDKLEDLLNDPGLGVPGTELGRLVEDIRERIEDRPVLTPSGEILSGTS